MQRNLHAEIRLDTHRARADSGARRFFARPRIGVRALFCIASVLAAMAATAGPLYTISLEWPVDAAGTHGIDVRDEHGRQPGIVVTPPVRFDAVMRQNAVVVPDLAVCEGAGQILLSIDIPDGSTATLTATRDRQALGSWPAWRTNGTPVLELAGTACGWRDDGIVGELTLAVDRPAPGTTLLEDVGHAWIEFRAAVAQAPTPYATLGTYSGLLLNGAQGGLNIDREFARSADAIKTMPLDAAGLNRVLAVVASYQAAGDSAWTIMHNCTAFATEAWYAASGEFLSTTALYPGASWEVTQLKLPNAGSLYHVLLAAGGQALDQTTKQSPSFRQR